MIHGYQSGMHGPIRGLSPLFRQTPIKHDRPRLLGGLVYREVLTDHDSDDVSELCGLQSSCGFEKKTPVVMPPIRLTILLAFEPERSCGHSESCWKDPQEASGAESPHENALVLRKVLESPV